MKRGVKLVGLWHFAELMVFDVHWSLFLGSFLQISFVNFPYGWGQRESRDCYFLNDVLVWQLDISVLCKCLFNELHYYCGCLASIRHVVHWMRNVTFWKVQVQDPRILMSVLQNVFTVVALDVLASHCLALMELLSTGIEASLVFCVKENPLKQN